MSDTVAEETLHYVNDPLGPVLVRFTPGNHAYTVTDPGYRNPKTGELEPKVRAPAGGATSLTGLMGKGEGLQKWPMYELKKYLKNLFSEISLTKLVDDPDYTIEGILQKGVRAHDEQSQLGKDVGTKAHGWIEEWSRAKQKSQEEKTEFVPPEIPEVEAIADKLKDEYLRIFNAVAPERIEDFKSIPKLLIEGFEMQERLWTEATMVRQSCVAAKEWLDQHPGIIVHGTEGTVYSRKFFRCGKYDSDWTVPCTELCNWCYRNGDNSFPEEDFTGRYVVDFKSTNSSVGAPKGIYPEYLAQCAIYMLAILEEFPDRHYDGSLILNGSKYVLKDKATGLSYPLFNSHFSFQKERDMAWAENLALLAEQIYEATQEMNKSNEGIQFVTDRTLEERS